jgi:outer membrane protein TolC
MAIDLLNIRQAELNLQRQINQLRVDVENAVIAIKNARARYEAARKERVLQEQTLDAEQKKYALGASTVFFVIQYQRDLAQAQSNEVAALAQYAKAHVELERILGETLDRYNINIQEAFAGKVSTPPSPLPQQAPQQP